MKITESLTDDAVMQELGKRIARLRIDSNYTQEKLAERAGVAKRTLERMEKGLQAQTTSLVRVLRSLGQLDCLDMILPPADEIRPMDLLRLKKKQRQRASSAALYKIQPPGGAWVWEDEKK
jgi:transcriptional regulator with XRE-family HTH domain